MGSVSETPLESEVPTTHGHVGHAEPRGSASAWLRLRLAPPLLSQIAERVSSIGRWNAKQLEGPGPVLCLLPPDAGTRTRSPPGIKLETSWRRAPGLRAPRLSSRSSSHAEHYLGASSRGRCDAECSRLHKRESRLLSPSPQL
ncbi:hypothetical protein EYF80_012111 [Liparis tanakae]|uniref:Uncharacterized protein n=1 Tax=Liparis tanakae TaxID=230148 RepID=A0A4Z2IKV1_9TELE|nr:hypothetical protein EYF80_012111 [Liparis tanakae]